MIAWRYLRARRAEGGVSTMTWISLIGITLAVFALVATLAIRAGLRQDFVDQMLGANAHAELHQHREIIDGRPGTHLFQDYASISAQLEQVDGVLDAAPLVRNQVMGSYRGRNVPIDVYGISGEDLRDYPMVAQSDRAVGDLARFDEGVALGHLLARKLGVTIGDRVKFISPDGVKTPMGSSPRVSAYEVVYVFSVGQQFIDASRAYMPLAQAQAFFNKDGAVDQFDMRVADPETVSDLTVQLRQIGGDRSYVWTWEDRMGDMLRALQMQDNAIFVVLSILILIAAMNIVSGLIMLVKNKGRDIGILRTMGLSQGSILRVFFLCGAWVGTAGTVFGIILGVIFALNIDAIYAFVNWVSGSGVAQLEANGFIFPSAVLEPRDIIASALLSLGLSWFITYFPARRAARMNPVEALRYE
jgi:lipoprotein-releasing system permease protein